MLRVTTILALSLITGCGINTQPRPQQPRYVPIQNQTPAQVAEAECNIQAREYYDAQVAEIRRRYSGGGSWGNLEQTMQVNSFEGSWNSYRYRGFMNQCMQAKGFQRN